MSRVGKAPIAVPDKVTVEIKKGSVSAKGPKGTLTCDVQPEVEVKLDDGKLLVTRFTDHRRARSLHGLTRALLSNLVVGVSAGFEKSLEIQGVGYRAAMQGSKLVMNLGFSHQVEYDKPADVDIDVKDQRVVIVTGIDRQRVGQVAAEIRRFKPPEPYKGTGIRYAGERVRRKEGKAGA